MQTRYPGYLARCYLQYTPGSNTIQGPNKWLPTASNTLQGTGQVDPHNFQYALWIPATDTQLGKWILTTSDALQGSKSGSLLLPIQPGDPGKWIPTLPNARPGSDAHGSSCHFQHMAGIQGEWIPATSNTRPESNVSGSLYTPNGSLLLPLLSGSLLLPILSRDPGKWIPTTSHTRPGSRSVDPHYFQYPAGIEGKCIHTTSNTRLGSQKSGSPLLPIHSGSPGKWMTTTSPLVDPHSSQYTPGIQVSRSPSLLPIHGRDPRSTISNTLQGSK
jgi:hypothetical protein